METRSPAVFGVLHKIQTFVLQVPLSILLFALSPFILLLSSPIFLWRVVVKYAALLWRNDLSKMLTTRGQMFAIDKIHEAPKCSIILTMIGEGSVDPVSVKDFITQRLFECPPKDASGAERYPELRQYLVKWGGYYFWKDDKNFSIDNHYTVIDDGMTYTEEDLKFVAQKQLGMKWVKGRPLWQVTVIKNYEPKAPKSQGSHVAIILRFHHSLGDGYSFLYFLTESLAGKEVINVVPNYFSKSVPLMLLYTVTFPFRAAWESSELFVRCIYSFALRVGHPHAKAMLEGPEGSKFKTELTASIPTSVVKDIKTHFKTSFTAVQFAAVAGALRDFYQRKGKKLRRNLPCLTVLPYPGHKLYKFRNHMGGAIVNLPICEPDPLKRLQYSQKDYNKIKRSTIPVLSFYALSVLGCFIRPITRLIMKNHPIPLGLTSFPAGLEKISFLGVEWTDCFVFLGTFDGKAGLCLVSLSYAETFRLSAVGHPSIFSEEDLRCITEEIQNNFHLLHQQIKLEV